MFPDAVPAVVIPAVDPMPSVPPASNENVPAPDTTTAAPALNLARLSTVIAPVMLKLVDADDTAAVVLLIVRLLTWNCVGVPLMAWAAVPFIVTLRLAPVPFLIVPLFVMPPATMNVPAFVPEPSFARNVAPASTVTLPVTVKVRALDP